MIDSTSPPSTSFEIDAPLDGLHRIISAANSSRSLDAALQTVAETVTDVMTTDVCSILLFDPAEERLYLRATRGLNPGAVGKISIGLGEGIIGLAAEEGRPIIVPDVQKDRRFRIEPLLGERAYGSMVAVPIILFARHERDPEREKLQGVIAIQHLSPRSFSDREVHFLEVVAGELAFFVANAQRYEQTDERLRQKIRELSTLQRVTAAIAGTRELPRVLNMIAEQAVNLSRVDRADIIQTDESGEQIMLLASHGGESDEKLGHAILKAAREKDVVGVVGASGVGESSELKSLAHEKGYQSIFYIPLRSGTRMIGIVALYAREARDFDYETVQLLSSFADAAAIALENARLFRELRRAVHIKDALLRELDHRVGNNLSKIKALLKMQKRRLEEDTPGAIALERSISQIEAMAEVQALLRDEEQGATSVREIAERVVRNKDGVHTGSPVRFSVHAEAIPLRGRDATIVALVLNEFVDNALRHGVASEGGEIMIEAAVVRGELLLAVHDDGPQHPPVSRPSSSGRGHSIIEALVTEGHGGFFHFEQSETRTTATVRLPYQPPG